MYFGHNTSWYQFLLIIVNMTSIRSVAEKRLSSFYTVKETGMEEELGMWHKVPSQLACVRLCVTYSNLSTKHCVGMQFDERTSSCRLLSGNVQWTLSTSSVGFSLHRRGNVWGDVSSDIQASFTDADGMASATESDQFETEVFEQATEMSPYIEATATQEVGEATPAVTTPEMPSDFKRTVILIHKATAFGENLFVRGGIDHYQREGCGDMDDLDYDPCSIPIRERILDINGPVDARDAWASGDDHLDWYGPEKGQGTFNGVAAQGTPAQWTTNDPNNDYYSSLNTFGPNYWLVDVDMDCSKTEDNFFEFKAVLNNRFEPTNSQLDVRCSGDEARDLPYHADNHFGLCGFINVVFEYGEGACEIVDFD